MFKLRITGDLGFEVWQDIPEYEGLYQVSTYGRIRSKDRVVNSGLRNNTTVIKAGRVLIPKILKRNYLRVSLSKNRSIKCLLVHRIVALTFLPTAQKHQNQVNHKDENPSNNRVENLEWCDAKYNCNYGTGSQRNGFSRRIVKDCLRQDDKEYMRAKRRKTYYKHREEIASRNKEYKEKHKAEYKEYMKKYYQEHKEALSMKMKEYREKNKEAVKERNKEYYRRQKNARIKISNQ